MTTGRWPDLLSDLARRRSTAVNARLDELCEFAPDGARQEELVYWFTQLVAWLRPRGPEVATSRVRFLRARLENHPAWRKNVAVAVGALVATSKVDQFLAYGGIPRDFHFLGAIGQWFSARLLPSPCRTTDVERILQLALREGDIEWLEKSGAVTLFVELLDEPLRARVALGLREATLDLAQQLAAQAHAPSVRSLAPQDRSSFRGLYEAVASLHTRAGSSDELAPPPLAPSSPHASIRGRIRQCLLAVESLRAQLAERGADLNTTFQLARMRQQLERLQLLVALHQKPESTLPHACAQLARASLRSARGAQLFARSSALVVQNLIDTTATVGTDYLDEERSSWLAAFRAGAGGGAIMVVATVLKFALSSLSLSPFYEGLVFSLNYMAAFCAAYLLHMTIATKLPAHTASALAKSLRGAGSRRERIGAFVKIWRSLLRLQTAGLAGNLLVAAPLAFAVDLVVLRLTAHHTVSLTKAEHLLAANSALGPSAAFAALTGVLLWLSSLLGAAVDNWARVSNLEDALATSLPVMRTVGAARAGVVARAVTHRIGGLFGNASLGLMLGAIPAAFAIAQLPVEIRHVTVSATSVAFAAAAGVHDTTALVLGTVGVAVIGIVNVVVSFALALWLSLRAGARADGSGTPQTLLALVGLRRWRRGVFRRGGARAASVVAPSTTAAAKPI